MSVRALILSLFIPFSALAQGFAGLGSTASDFAPVTAPADLAFPRDHGPHPGFRIEWWYLTANLTGDDGADYGVQWTLFRTGLAPGKVAGGAAAGWDDPQIWFAHAALTTAERHFVAERFARGGIGQAGVELSPFRAWIDDWQMAGATGDAASGGSGRGDALGALRVTAAGEDFAYDLAAWTDAAPVPQGAAGFSVKSTVGQASYYYSQPFYTVEGTLTIAGRAVAVTGQAWLDREWSSQPLTAGQEGWDWFSLHLADGAKVMAYRFREGGGQSYLSGTWIAPDGTPTPLGAGQISLTPLAEADVSGRALPIAWRVEIPAFGLAVDTEALNAQSWMDTSFPYWEGPITVSGSQAGRGYLEMTGYE